MKLLLITDLHSQKTCIEYLKEILKKEKPQGIIISGDITVSDDTHFLQKVFALIEETGAEGFVIWGNADMPQVQKQILSSPYNVHLKQRHLDDLTLFGISYMEDYPAFDPSNIKDSILITHQPPLKQNLERPVNNAPQYHISGHLHKAAFVKKYSSTTHIQVPTLMDKRYATFDPTSSTVDFKSI